MKNDFYTYAWLRVDGTPYYIGKGRKTRAFRKHGPMTPPPKERVLFLKKDLTEAEAFKHEIYMIFLFGRKDKCTGILHNRTDGGEGLAGNFGPLNPMFGKPRLDLIQRNKDRIGEIRDETYREKISQVTKGELNPMFGRRRPDLSERNRSKAGIPLKQETIQKMKEKAKNRMWITNGEKETLVNRESVIPSGWRLGRKRRENEN